MMLRAAVFALLLPLAAAAMPPVADIAALPAELRAEARAYVLERSPRADERRLAALTEFIVGAEGLALHYATGDTRTAAQAYADRQANCLSFTLLFIALADEVGLDAQAQEYDRVLSWYEPSGVIVTANHINVGVRIGQRRLTVDIDGSPRVTLKPPSLIPRERLLAHYYNNRGAELMVAGDLDAAARQLQQALALDADFAAAWNNQGVLNSRRGDPAAAEQAYLTALRHAPAHPPTLFNLVALYQRSGDAAGLARYQRQLEHSRRADPFHHFLLGQGSEQQGQYLQAIAHYRDAIRLHGQEALFHFGLARAYALAGEPQRAARSQARAETLSRQTTPALFQGPQASRWQ